MANSTSARGRHDQARARKCLMSVERVFDVSISERKHIFGTFIRAPFDVVPLARSDFNFSRSFDVTDNGTRAGIL
jgi:hypothetical protein